MTYVRVFVSRPECPGAIRKPLLYPSELRGHGRASLLHRINLRKAPLALSQVRLRGLATVMSLKQRSTGALVCTGPDATPVSVFRSARFFIRLFALD